VLEVAEAMVEEFANALELYGDRNEDGWLAASPLALPTEREVGVLAGRGATSTEPGTAFRAIFRAREG